MAYNLQTASSTTSGSTSSSSSPSGCGGYCRFDTVTGSTDCSDCSDHCYCEPPFISGLMQTDDPILNIACNPVPDLNAGTLECPAGYETVAWVRVPVVQNPITYRNVRLPLNEQVTQVGLNSIGWQIYIFRVNSGPATPTISPMCVPKCSPEPTDRALAVSVVLPHGKSSQQFWVPVIEQVGYAQLQTDRWLVVIIRVPVEGIPLPPVHHH